MRAVSILFFELGVVVVLLQTKSNQNSEQQQNYNTLDKRWTFLSVLGFLLFCIQ